jgi:hypothetical protein
MTTRRYPPPWRAEKMPGGYVARDANDQALAYVYSRANEAEAMQACHRGPFQRHWNWDSLVSPGGTS